MAPTPGAADHAHSHVPTSERAPEAFGGRFLWDKVSLVEIPPTLSVCPPDMSGLT